MTEPVGQPFISQETFGCNAELMASERRIVCIDNAPWLPPGSAAEVWVGDECAPDPSIIVRLLLTATNDLGARTFFCVPTPKGLDLPTLFLGRDADRMSVGAGLAQLQRATLDDEGHTPRCIGYVRNVVPSPDASYPHPTPYAHVPVFLAHEGTMPTVGGQWVTIDQAREDLAVRHWWPIVVNHLA